MTDAQPIRVFVYGTLKPGGYYWPRFCEGKVDAWEPAKARGRIYHLPLGYPGMILDESAWAMGFVLTLKDDAALAGFDYLEGYDAERPPEENDYDRPLIEVFTPEGEPLGMAWTYTMSPERIAEHRGKLVENGNWVAPPPRNSASPF